MSREDNFFEEMRDQSHVKVEIVKNYFLSWANVLLPSVEKKDGRLGYIDLFSGPGLYEDKTKSTPIIVIEEAIKSEKLRKRLVIIFNDANHDYIKSLEEAIEKIPGIDQLENKPILMHDSVGDKLANKFKEINFIPSLFFIDPWGYKGLSLSLFKSVLKDWGCDCIFFFNYNRINMSLKNPLLDYPVNALFGEKRASTLRERVANMSPKKRELTIIEELRLAIAELGFRFFQPFCFKDETGKKTSHFIIFISKHEKGYGIMKEIMAHYSSRSEQGVPTFEYCPATKKQPFLPQFKRPLDDLSKMLLDEFAGKSLKMIEIFRRHHVGKPFIGKNYKDILYKMEEQGLIKAKPRLSDRKKETFGNDVLVTFPEKK